jgi:hypothetical protein
MSDQRRAKEIEAVDPPAQRDGGSDSIAPTSIKKASEYREHAEECRTLARWAKSADDRALFLNMAATWESLAQARGKQLAKKMQVDE